MKFNRTCLVVAMACGMPWISAQAQSAADLQKEITSLKAHLKALQDKVDAMAQMPAPETVDLQEFNRIKIKVESAEDNALVLGTSNLKISGMLDPTFIYNQRQNQSGFNFLHNFDGRGNSSAGNPNISDGYSYDNSYFGLAVLDVQKEMESGTKWRLTLAPHKSASSGYNYGSIVHEASVSVPVSGPSTRLIAGQMPDWSGYEYYFSYQQPLITHNLLFDFTIPSYYSGAGMEFTRGKWISKILIGNINQTRRGAGDKTPGLTYRVDFAKGEFSGFGFAGNQSFSSTADVGQFNLFEIDGFFNRGNWVMQGQIGLGSQKSLATNGGTARWTGFSGLIGYKITPRLQATTRFDWIRNGKNGGGVFGASAAERCKEDGDVNGDLVIDDRDCVSIADGRNGFGPIMSVNEAGKWLPTPKGASRTALTLGMSYVLNQNTTLKAEYRLDQADGPVFFDVKSESYKKSNNMIGLSAVVSF